MTLESQVTNLELSKKLKELGVKQESLFYWQLFNDGADLTYSGGYEGNSLNQLKGMSVSAYTVAELGELMPNSYMFYKTNNYWICEDLDTFIEPSFKGNFFNTPIEACANMLIHLIEKGLITP